MKKKLPRKLKKELRKIKGWEMIQPQSWHMTPYGYHYREELRLHEGVKVNKWTKRLIRKFYTEKRLMIEKVYKQSLENQRTWAAKGLYRARCYVDKMLLAKSSEEFRREYMNEPIEQRNDEVIKGISAFGNYTRKTPRQEGIEPNFMIIDDLDELMPNIHTPQEHREWIERMKLWYISQMSPDSHGDCFAPQAVIKIKEGAIDSYKIEEFKKEWEKQMKSGSPIMLKGSEASVEFIPAKRPHRLHNHPRMEMEFCAEDEVIVDVEFVNKFCWARPIMDGKTGKQIQDHVIVRKVEFQALVETEKRI